MKFRFFLVFLCLFSLLLAVPAAAVEAGADDGATSAEPIAIETTKDEEGVTVNVTIQQPDSSSAEISDTEMVEPDSVSSYTVSNYGLSENGSSDIEASVSTMSDAIKGVLGEYYPRTYTVSQYAADGTLLGTTTEIVPGLAGLDYEWIVGAVLFALFLYGILRMIGGFLCSR